MFEPSIPKAIVRLEVGGIISVKVEPLYKKPLNVVVFGTANLVSPTMFEPSIPWTRVVVDPG